MARAKADIARVYAQYAAAPGDFVRLVDITNETDIPPEAWREALTDLYRSQQINLIPQSNQRTLTMDQRRYAFRIGGEDKHLISMGRP